MISLDEARTRVLNGVLPLPAVDMPLEHCLGRILAQDVKAQRTQPPQDLSSMDGYAVIAGDASPLKILGESAAGRPYLGTIKTGECVRIFTGAALPNGANAIIMQEDVQREAETITFTTPAAPQKYVRKRGMDFQKDKTALKKGEKLHLGSLGSPRCKSCCAFNRR
jgi:molybdopterin molybdotransferase